MLSVIIPITGENRKNHAISCLHFLNRQTLARKLYEIILVEQVNCILGGSRTGGPYYKGVEGIDRYVAIEDPGENHFNQPWMANVGARVAKGSKFLFYDIDLVCDSTYLKAVYGFNFPYFIAWHKMFALDAAKSNLVQNEKKIVADYIASAEVYKSGPLAYAGFSTCAKRHFFFNRVGGYNENFLGWGGNDNDLAWRAMKILGKCPSLQHRLFHLWHPKGYVKNLFWHRRSVWLTTYKHPQNVTRRLLGVNVGNLNKQTYINIKDIYVDAKKEQQKKRLKKIRKGK